MAGPLQLYLAMTTERLSTDLGREHWCDGEPGRQPLAADGRLRKAGPLCSGLDNCYCCCCLPSRLPAQTSSTSYRLLSFQPTAHHSPIGSCQTDQTGHSSINLINPIKEPHRPPLPSPDQTSPLDETACSCTMHIQESSDASNVSQSKQAKASLARLQPSVRLRNLGPGPLACIPVACDGRLRVRSLHSLHACLLAKCLPPPLSTRHMPAPSINHCCRDDVV
jgi:hypothetical protein